MYRQQKQEQIVEGLFSLSIYFFFMPAGMHPLNTYIHLKLRYHSLTEVKSVHRNSYKVTQPLLVGSSLVSLLEMSGCTPQHGEGWSWTWTMLGGEGKTRM